MRHETRVWLAPAIIAAGVAVYAALPSDAPPAKERPPGTPIQARIVPRIYRSRPTVTLPETLHLAHPTALHPRLRFTREILPRLIVAQLLRQALPIPFAPAFDPSALLPGGGSPPRGR